MIVILLALILFALLFPGVLRFVILCAMALGVGAVLTSMAHAQSKDPIYDEMQVFSSNHGMSVDQLVKKSGIGLFEFEDYIRGGQKVGRPIDSMIELLTASNSQSRVQLNPTQPNPTSTKLALHDVAMIIDTYKKNEIRFVRDVRGKEFDDDVQFVNARQNLIETGSFTLTFGPGTFSGNVTCKTSEQSAINTIADWNKGDIVHLSGNVSDVTFGDVQLKDCTMTHQ